MENVISFTPAQLIALILGVCGAIVTISAAIGVISKVLAKARAPEVEQNNRLDNIDRRLDEIDKTIATFREYFTNDDNRSRLCSGAFSYLYDVYHNDGWDGWVRNSLMEFKASRSWSGVSGESPDYTNSTGNSEVLKPENLKRHRVLAWIRIA